MNMPFRPSPVCARRHRSAGFSLIELLVALLLGLVMVAAFGTIYASSQSAARRVEQLSGMQQAVRTAFDYFTNDVHAVGLTGCQQRRTSGFSPTPTGNLSNNFAVSIEGYNAIPTPTYPLATTATATNWSNNPAVGTASAFSMSVLGSTELTLGSDVLILRTVGSRPLRLVSDTSGTQITLENVNLGGVCSYNSPRTSGFCAGNWALIASCTRAQVFQVASLATPGTNLQLTLTSALANTYTTAATEVFPLQTIMYYVRAGSTPNTQSLYRRIFDGDDGGTGGEEQELVENVESLQVTYGVDAVNNPDGSRNYSIESYVTANNVLDWSQVLAVRMSVLIRSHDPLRGEATAAPSASVNDVAVVYPTTGDAFDRRVFTTTVALRNRIQ